MKWWQDVAERLRALWEWLSQPGEPMPEASEFYSYAKLMDPDL